MGIPGVTFEASHHGGGLGGSAVDLVRACRATGCAIQRRLDPRPANRTRGVSTARGGRGLLDGPAIVATRMGVSSSTPVLPRHLNPRTGGTWKLAATSSSQGWGPPSSHRRGPVDRLHSRSAEFGAFRSVPTVGCASLLRVGRGDLLRVTWRTRGVVDRQSEGTSRNSL